MARTLTISPTPFRSSNLALPPSPFSPRLPITPPASPLQYLHSLAIHPPTTSTPILPPPITHPLHWLWQCHLCHRTYKLSTTRRCLDDGHYFCSGTTSGTTSRRGGGNKRSKRHRACASEFDYQGWAKWGEWRRVVSALSAADGVVGLESAVSPLFGRAASTSGAVGEREIEAEILATMVPTTGSAQKANACAKDCWNSCDYPNQCRWGKQILGAREVVVVPSVEVGQQDDRDSVPATTFEDILAAEQLDASRLEQDSDGDAEAAQSGSEGLDLLASLVASAKNRKRKSASLSASPLSTSLDNDTSATSTLSFASETETEMPSALVSSDRKDQSSAAEMDAELERMGPRQSASSTAAVLARAFDEFEADVRKGLGRANELVASVVGSLRASSALEDEDAGAFVKGLRIGRKK